MMAFLRIALAALALIGLVGLVGPLAACGKSSPPTLPRGQSDGYPHQYPRQ
jgi:hypothetical protein